LLPALNEATVLAGILIFSFVNGLIKKKLESKNLPVDSKDYENIDYIDEKTGKPIYNNVKKVKES